VRAAWVAGATEACITAGDGEGGGLSCGDGEAPLGALLGVGVLPEVVDGFGRPATLEMAKPASITSIRPATTRTTAFRERTTVNILHDRNLVRNRAKGRAPLGARPSKPARL
jgi:hypothetical protein